MSSPSHTNPFLPTIQNIYSFEKMKWVVFRWIQVTFVCLHMFEMQWTRQTYGLILTCRQAMRFSLLYPTPALCNRVLWIYTFDCNTLKVKSNFYRLLYPVHLILVIIYQNTNTLQSRWKLAQKFRLAQGQIVRIGSYLDIASYSYVSLDLWLKYYRRWVFH